MKDYRIGILGLGYVGLPLAIEFSKKFNTLGFDIDSKRVNEINNGFDRTNEVDKKNLLEVIKLKNRDSKKGLKHLMNQMT